MSWEVGDLALCADGRDGCCTCCGEKVFDTARIYRLGAINGEMLWFPEARQLANHHNFWGGWDFRKIRPDEHEACEPEFVTLLKRKKVAAHA